MDSRPLYADYPLDEGDVRVLVVAGDPLARAGLATLLASQPGCVVAGQVAASDEVDWPAQLDAFSPDVVLWDFGWEAESGVAGAALEQLAGNDGEPDGEGGSLPVLALLPDESLAAEAWGAGARGLLPREAGAGRLVSALHALSQGLAVLDPAVARPLLPASAAPDVPPGEPLTPRELEVLQLLAEGLANRAIAQRLDISEHTVKFHVNAILGKLGAQSRTEAVVRGTRLGLIIL